MSLGEAAVQTVGTTGQGIVKGGKAGTKVGGVAGMFAGAAAALIPGLALGTATGVGWAAVAAVTSAAAIVVPAVAAGLVVAALTVSIGGLLGAAGGGLGGGWLGASGGGLLGFIGGLFKGGKELGKKTPDQQMQDLRTMAAVSDGQVAQTEAYLQQQRMQEEAMNNLKMQRAASSESVANPDAGDKNAAKVTQSVTNRTTTLSV